LIYRIFYDRFKSPQVGEAIVKQSRRIKGITQRSFFIFPSNQAVGGSIYSTEKTHSQFEAWLAFPGGKVDESPCNADVAILFNRRDA